MKYNRFKTEDELLKSTLDSLFYEAYPKVSVIGGKKISPDIDILEIQKVSQNQFRLIGYEIKLMKFHKTSKGLSWYNFYNGIGQAFIYLKNGVQRVVLVLGFDESVYDDKLIDEFCNRLDNKKDLLRSILGSYISIGVYLYRKAGIHLLIKTDSYFLSVDKEVRLLSNELLQGKFKFNKRLKSN